MGGFLEDFVESKIVKWVSNISWLPELKHKAERELFVSHAMWMAYSTLTFSCIGLLTKNRWLAIPEILNYAQALIAEWPPKGRRVDWVSRSLGWILGIWPVPFLLLIA